MPTSREHEIYKLESNWLLKIFSILYFTYIKKIYISEIKEFSMKRSNKRKYHARRRAIERYNFILTPRIEEGFIKQIRGNEAIFLYRISGRLSTFAVIYDGRYIPVFYDRHRGQITSLLPEDRLEKYAKNLPPLESDTKLL